ncbi:hypothetical protein R2A130_0310 [Ahrensia sp. R2A130]|nr:hypothetical protein R2A130_0310 [Ahrensia sp. R2A130]
MALFVNVSFTKVAVVVTCWQRFQQFGESVGAVWLRRV